MNLFQSGNFVLNSGEISYWKVDCDALTNEDIETCAQLIANKVGTFSGVIGVPIGGARLAKALEKYSNDNGPAPCLIVDDVLTTGASMEEARKHLPISKGCVIFARGQLPDWIDALWKF